MMRANPEQRDQSEDGNDFPELIFLDGSDAAASPSSPTTPRNIHWEDNLARVWADQDEIEEKNNPPEPQNPTRFLQDLSRWMFENIPFLISLFYLSPNLEGLDALFWDILIVLNTRVDLEDIVIRLLNNRPEPNPGFFNILEARVLINTQWTSNSVVPYQAPPARVAFATSLEPGYAYLCESREHQLFHYFHNRETFYRLTPVHELKSENRLVLDGYAFDISELIEYSKSKLQAIYRNPHAGIERLESSDFSHQARLRMMAIPELREKIKVLKQELKSQVLVNQKTLDLLIAVLQAYNKGDDEETSLAKLIFKEHRFALDRYERECLDNFLIEVPSVWGGYQRMKFDAAYNGGYDQCHHVAQIFLWQFVLKLRPQAMKLMPAAVKSLAFAADLRITAPAAVEEKAADSWGVSRWSPQLFQRPLQLLQAVGAVVSQAVDEVFDLHRDVRGGFRF